LSRDTLYIGVICFDSEPGQIVFTQSRRDADLNDTDSIQVVLDTFNDNQNGFVFGTNPAGLEYDGQVAGEGLTGGFQRQAGGQGSQRGQISGFNPNWDGDWAVRSRVTARGWETELAIPLKTLRYIPGPDKTWGFNVMRNLRRRNEQSFLAPIPRGSNLHRVSLAADLNGLTLPSRRDLKFVPYVAGHALKDFTLSDDQVDRGANVGLDAKWGITPTLTADFTVNTDFAQVEADEQQVNLTRFSLFLPEKRDFFLEGRGNFDFARGGASGGFSQTASDTPTLFYSRRIGLNRGRVIPIDAGGRLTGKVGRWGIGAVNIQADDEETSRTEATNFTVLRVKRDILRRSTIGAIYTNRSVGASAALPGQNQAYGVDAAFAFYQNVAGGAYYARTETDGLEGDDESYQGRIEWVPDRYGARFEHTKVGAAFNPEVGFLRRSNFEKTQAYLRFSPRPADSRLVRKYTTEATVDYFLNGNGSVETRTQTGRFNVEFQSSDQVAVEASDNYEALFVPFNVGGGVIIPVGGYDFTDATVAYTLGQQRRFTGTVALQAGQFYDGTITALTLSSARYAILKQFSVEPSLSLNRIDLPYGRFTTELYRARTDYAFSARMFLSALLQYSSGDNTFSSNIRYRWEYIPGSEFFLVWTDEHDTRPNSVGLRNRAFVVKLTRLLRF
jgi:hypothetical protein